MWLVGWEQACYRLRNGLAGGLVDFLMINRGSCNKAPASFDRLTKVVFAMTLVKATINRDLLCETDAKITSVNPFCPSRLNFVQ
jgi:hypothetical protein